MASSLENVHYNLSGKSGSSKIGQIVASRGETGLAISRVDSTVSSVREYRFIYNPLELAVFGEKYFQLMPLWLLLNDTLDSVPQSGHFYTTDTRLDFVNTHLDEQPVNEIAVLDGDLFGEKQTLGVTVYTDDGTMISFLKDCWLATTRSSRLCLW
jgi:hypothetical protein